MSTFNQVKDLEFQKCSHPSCIFDLKVKSEEWSLQDQKYAYEFLKDVSIIPQNLLQLNQQNNQSFKGPIYLNSIDNQFSMFIIRNQDTIISSPCQNRVSTEISNQNPVNNAMNDQITQIIDQTKSTIMELESLIAQLSDAQKNNQLIGDLKKYCSQFFPRKSNKEISQKDEEIQKLTAQLNDEKMKSVHLQNQIQNLQIQNQNSVINTNMQIDPRCFACSKHGNKPIDFKHKDKNEFFCRDCKFEDQNINQEDLTDIQDFEVLSLIEKKNFYIKQFVIQEILKIQDKQKIPSQEDLQKFFYQADQFIQSIEQIFQNIQETVQNVQVIQQNPVQQVAYNPAESNYVIGSNQQPIQPEQIDQNGQFRLCVQNHELLQQVQSLFDTDPQHSRYQSDEFKKHPFKINDQIVKSLPQPFDESQFNYGIFELHFATFEGMLDKISGKPKGFGRLIDNNQQKKNWFEDGQFNDNGEGMGYSRYICGQSNQDGYVQEREDGR